jgi:hypothetical protein
MSSFAQTMDLSEIIRKVKDAVVGQGLLDKLFIFAALSSSPDPSKLVSDAKEAIKMHPLSSMFGVAHMDREGMVFHRSQGGGFGDNDTSAIGHKIAQFETIRRQQVAFGAIEIARQSILGEHFISEDVLGALLKFSPFIPSDLAATFTRAFTRFFQGDYVSATYILTPLLENSIRPMS